MKKIISLIKVSLNHDMNIFKINTKKQGKFSKFIVPTILTIYIMFIIGIYSGKLMSMLKPANLEFAVLTLFALGVCFLSLMEGIYKSSTLLFNSKDDNLLFSLPIKKSTVLFIRLFKFYVFELLYNSLFILPAMVIYAVDMLPGWTYYLSSFIALLLLPIIPIVLSCVVGFIITFLSSRFKGKNVFQTLFTTAFLLLFIYLYFNMDGFVNNIVEKATSINDLIIRIYYPVGAYITLINNFNIITLIMYIAIHVVISIISILILGKLYFKINSNFKKVLVSHKNKKYSIKNNSKMKSFVKKELNKFFSTPVFVTNAGFGLVLFVVGCILCSLKFDSIVQSIIKMYPDITIEYINSKLPLIMFGLVCFASFMTSITSSMISLEGKSFSILKSIPLKPIKIVMYKVVTALIIMLPCIFIGDIIIFIRFKFDIISILLIFAASVILPFVSELLGIIINLKYPKIDASNDTEVVKQSMSSLVATLIGIGLLGVTIVSLFMLLDKNISNGITILLFITFYGIVALILCLILNKVCDKYFNNISV